MEVEMAVIGGTGFYHPKVMDDVEEKIIDTKYGEAVVQLGNYEGEKIAFLARHGRRHGIPPHKINYRANISALQELGVKRVFATTAVGSLRKDILPGAMVIIDQFIDFTKIRQNTFYDGEDGNVVHTDLTEPYCQQLREQLKLAMKKKDVPFVDRGTYICTEGPRYETPAEIKTFAMWGADVVGMTTVPEATLAREAGLCYANLSLVTNLAAGLSADHLTHQEIVEIMKENINIIRELFMETLSSIPAERNCLCWYKEKYDLGE